MALKYTTVQGDTWDMISLKLLGSEQHTPLLMQANPHLLQTVVFSANTVLDLPTIPATTAVNLPPWKRSGSL
ncbi:tail protein X [Paenibacillus sp. TAB 01]|uniref:tail protein X n=1 Tax=Paenibacillus sp. TAB 01 TaxID=3368988 RepID=UPI0037513057